MMKITWKDQEGNNHSREAETIVALSNHVAGYNFKPDSEWGIPFHRMSEWLISHDEEKKHHDR
jgi:hypothetical protein